MLKKWGIGFLKFKVCEITATICPFKVPTNFNGVYSFVYSCKSIAFNWCNQHCTHKHTHTHKTHYCNNSSVRNKKKIPLKFTTIMSGLFNKLWYLSACALVTDILPKKWNIRSMCSCIRNPNLFRHACFPTERLEKPWRCSSDLLSTLLKCSEVWQEKQDRWFRSYRHTSFFPNANCLVPELFRTFASQASVFWTNSILFGRDFFPSTFE